MSGRSCIIVVSRFDHWIMLMIGHKIDNNRCRLRISTQFWSSIDDVMELLVSHVTKSIYDYKAMKSSFDSDSDEEDDDHSERIVSLKDAIETVCSLCSYLWDMYKDIDCSFFDLIQNNDNDDDNNNDDDDNSISSLFDFDENDDIDFSQNNDNDDDNNDDASIRDICDICSGSGKLKSESRNPIQWLANIVQIIPEGYRSKDERPVSNMRHHSHYIRLKRKGLMNMLRSKFDENELILNNRDKWRITNIVARYLETYLGLMIMSNLAAYLDTYEDVKNIRINFTLSNEDMYSNNADNSNNPNDLFPNEP